MHPDTIIGVLLISAVTTADIRVTQSPEIIEVTEGMKFHLSCIFTASNVPAVAAYTWYKQVPGRENSTVKNASGEFIGRVSEQDANSFKANKVASITIMDAKQNDSGIYYCEVDFVYRKGTGIGTRVTVKGADDNNMGHPSSTSKNNLMIVSSVLGLIVFMLLLTTVLIVWCTCKHRDRTPRNGMEEQGATSDTVVYANLRIKNNGNLSKDQRACPAVRASEQNEDTIVYAKLAPLNKKRNKKQTAPALRRPPNEIGEPDV